MKNKKTYRFRVNRFLYVLFIGVALFVTYGCPVSMYLGLQDEKIQMDLAEQVYGHIDDVWQASLNATQELKITVDDKMLEEKKGLIIGHTNELGFVRIHLEQLELELVLIGIQARKSSTIIFGGVNRVFAHTLLQQIKKNMDKYLF